MKAGEHLKSLTWGNPVVSCDRRDFTGIQEPSSKIFDYGSWKIVRSLDPWKPRIKTKVCPVCGGKYLPTPQSKRRCIPCNYQINN